MPKAETVDQYLKFNSKWAKQLKELRTLLLSYKLDETIKWGAPVYMKDGKNLIGIAAFKNHYGLWFFHGALLKNNTKLFVNSQEGKTQSMRQIKFDKNSVLELESLKLYIDETLSLHDQGKLIKKIKPKIIIAPFELKKAFLKNKKLKSAFNLLTPGKKKEYCLYISDAKREVTKQNRLDKVIPMILEGKGLNDKYKNC